MLKMALRYRGGGTVLPRSPSSGSATSSNFSRYPERAFFEPSPLGCPYAADFLGKLAAMEVTRR